MINLYEDESYKDITFELDLGIKWRAHRCMLAVSNVEWFKTILRFQSKESKAEIIPVRECSSEAFDIALKWCYGIVADYYLKYHFEAASRFMCKPILQRRVTFKMDFIPLAFRYSPEFDDLCSQITIWDHKPFFDSTPSEDIVIFVLEKFGPLTADVIFRLLHVWTQYPELLAMKTATIILLKQIDIGAIYRERGQYHVMMKHALETLVKTGYYDQREVSKFSEYQRAVAFERYPLKVGYTSQGAVTDGSRRVGYFDRMELKFYPLDEAKLKLHAVSVYYEN